MEICNCTICGEPSEDIRHLSLYVNGSEGCDVCLDCRIILTETAKGMIHIAAKSRRIGYMAAENHLSKN